MVLIAPCDSLNFSKRARRSNVTLKLARDEGRYRAYFCSREKIWGVAVLHLCAADSNHELATPSQVKLAAPLF